MKIGFVDVETTSLDADGWGQLLCGVVAEYQAPTGNKKPWTNIQVFTLDDYKNKRWDDKNLALRIQQTLIGNKTRAFPGYDVTASWNGIKFDENFVRTRLKEYGLSTPVWVRHKDLMYTARYKLKMASASLDNVATFLGIEKKYGIKKTRLDKKRWRMAIMGHEPSYNYVIQHCIADVKVLACLWEELKHLVTEIK